MSEERKPLTGPRYYDAAANPDGAQLLSVPMRDLSAEEFEALPIWVQYSIDASPLYRKTKPRAAAADKAEAAPSE